MPKYVVMAIRGPTMNQTMNGISVSKINERTSDIIKIKKKTNYLMLFLVLLTEQFTQKQNSVVIYSLSSIESDLQ